MLEAEVYFPHTSVFPNHPADEKGLQELTPVLRMEKQVFK